jgi:phage protein D
MPSSPNSSLVEIDVLINGSPVPAEVMSYIGEVVVDDSVELPSMFTFAMMSSDALEQDLPWVDNKKFFAVGNVVEIKMGERNNLTSLITGEITALEPEFVANRLPVFNVQGYDRRHRLQRGRKTRTFLKKKDSDIAAQIGAEAGLRVQSTGSNTTLDYVVQANQTDWEFLCERARLIGYEVMVADRTLFFRPAGNAQKEILTLDMQDDIIEFYPRLSSTGQATEVKVQSWNIKDKKAVLGNSKSGDEVSVMGGQSSGAKIVQSAFGAAPDVVIDQPVGAQAEADQIAKARFNELILELITGEGTCHGNVNLRAGKVIRIAGIGQRFGGQYYVTSAIHRNSAASGYVTEFRVRRNAS